MPLLLNDSSQDDEAVGTPKRIYYLHIPKCGGTSVAHLWRTIHPKGVQLPVLKVKADVKHCLLEHVDEPYDLSITTVRHPVSWYESWWRYLRSPKVLDRSETLGEDGKPDWDSWIGKDVWHPLRGIAHCHDPSFDRFIDNIIDYAPGFVSQMYRTYLGDSNDALPVDEVIKLETLHVDFTTFCRSIGLAAPLVKKHENRSSSDVLAIWSAGQKTKITALEADAINRFGYDNISRPVSI